MELDFHEVYGLDLGDFDLLRSRSCRWMRTRLLGLLSVECRVQRVLNPTEEQKKARARAH